MYPPGYPSTYLENINVVDSFFGGAKIYDYVPETRTCIRFLVENIDYINVTLNAWNMTHPDTPTMYNQGFDVDVMVYNITQGVT